MKSNLPQGITSSRPAAALVVALAVLVTLSAGTMLVHAGEHGRWGATTFQLYNLDEQPAPVTVRFYDDDGLVTLSFTDTLPARGTRFYEPELTHGLPPTFTGLLDVDSDQAVYGVVHHLADPADPDDGNLVHRMLHTGVLTTSIYLPFVDWNHDGWFTIVYLQNPHGENVTASVTYFTMSGIPVGQHNVIIGPHGTRTADPPPGLSFVGSALVQAARPILVTVSRRHVGHRLAYNGHLGGSWLLRAPDLDSAHSFIAVQNTSPSEVADVQVTFHWPLPEVVTATVAPLATHILTSTQNSSLGRALVTGTQPLAAVIVTEQLGGSSDSAQCYSALQPERASPCVVVPSVLHGYQGWYTTLWIQNLAPSMQEVEVLFTAAPTGTLAYTRTPMLAPGAAYPVSLDEHLSPEFQHAAALVVGSTKVGAVVRQSNRNSTTNSIMEYEGYDAGGPCDIPAPAIHSVTPSMGPIHGIVVLTIDGDHFQWGATVALSRTGEAPIVASDVSVTGATTIAARLDLTGAAIGPWDVVVTNADGRTTAAQNGFKVLYQLYLPLAARG